MSERIGLVSGKDRKGAKEDKRKKKKEGKKEEKMTKKQIEKMEQLEAKNKAKVKKGEKFLEDVEKARPLKDRLKKDKTTKKMDDKKIAKAEAHFKKVKGQHMMDKANAVLTKDIVSDTKHRQDLDRARTAARKEAGASGSAPVKPIGTGYIGSTKAFVRTGGYRFEPKHIVMGYTSDSKQRGSTYHVSKDTTGRHTEQTRYTAHHHFPIKD
tara:strand:- start:1674 stop:2306 length:633 start_codon:yes stop_codon:yes gene_type:complete